MSRVEEVRRSASSSLQTSSHLSALAAPSLVAVTQHAYDKHLLLDKYLPGPVWFFHWPKEGKLTPRIRANDRIALDFVNAGHVQAAFSLYVLMILNSGFGCSDGDVGNGEHTSNCNDTSSFFMQEEYLDVIAGRSGR
jgi:hypothetical protein